jgi:hypothetical protein
MTGDPTHQRLGERSKGAWAKLGHWWVAGGVRAAKKSLRASSRLKITGRTKIEKKRVLFFYFSKGIQTCEFKYQFEFKQQKNNTPA